jgi:hypothetical protein
MHWSLDSHITNHITHTYSTHPIQYGRFGHGFGFETGGWAHVEEVRNALQVFRESHRAHRAPNMNHDPFMIGTTSATPKPLYAYADTFAHPASGSGGIREYYLATAFTHVQLQQQGALNLFGLHATNSFFKDALNKYGVKVHVFKHGAYKNMANMFTENRFTKEHRENVQNIVQALNQHFCYNIYYQGRPQLQNFEFSNFWNMVQNRAGTFHAEMAHKVGFVDFLPRLDPLDQLVASNQSDQAKVEMKQKWGSETDMDLFLAQESILITDYAKRVAKRIKKRQKKWDLYQQLKVQAESSPGVQRALSALGYHAILVYE